MDHNKSAFAGNRPVARNENIAGNARRDSVNNANHFPLVSLDRPGYGYAFGYAAPGRIDSESYGLLLSDMGEHIQERAGGNSGVANLIVKAKLYGFGCILNRGFRYLGPLVSG